MTCSTNNVALPAKKFPWKECAAQVAGAAAGVVDLVAYPARKFWQEAKTILSVGKGDEAIQMIGLGLLVTRNAGVLLSGIMAVGHLALMEVPTQETLKVAAGFYGLQMIGSHLTSDMMVGDDFERFPFRRKVMNKIRGESHENTP